MAQAVVFDGAGKDLLLTMLPLPEDVTMQEDEVLVRIVAATVCGSDLHTIRGLRIEPTPAILGHEGVGCVEASRRPTLSPGQLVTFSVCDVCGTCARCSAGLTQKCTQLMKYGHTALSSGCGLNGCYASHLLIRAGTHVVALPPRLAHRPALAAPANCALATVMCAARTAQRHLQATPKTRALVQGAGLLGLFACCVLRDRLNFPAVFCCDVVAERREMARKFGATPLTPADLDSSTDAARDLADSFDVVIEVCGNAQVIPPGVRCLRPGGLYLIVGLVHPDSQLSVTGQQLIRKCLTITGIHNYQAEDLDAAVQYLDHICTNNTYPLECLFSSPFSLENMQAALKEAGHYYRVLIQP